MGRPLAHAPGEVRGFEERARYMLGDRRRGARRRRPGRKPGFERQIKRVPLGVVAVVAPWNYPYLTAVNAVMPALIAGNAVVLKHSHQTPLCAERFAEAFASAGLARRACSSTCICRTRDTARLMGDPRVATSASPARWPAAARSSRRRRPVHDRRASSSAARTRPMCAPTPTSRTRSRT